MASQDQLLAHASDTSAYDAQTNATATATIAAKTGYVFYVTNIELSLSAAPSAAMVFQLKSGSTVKKQYQIPAAATAPVVINFSRPFKLTVSEAATVTTGAAGTGIICTIGISGFWGTP